jgi:hypothetical protein
MNILSDLFVTSDLQIVFCISYPLCKKISLIRIETPENIIMILSTGTQLFKMVVEIAHQHCFAKSS